MQRKIVFSLALVGVLAAAQNEVELKSLEGVTVGAKIVSKRRRDKQKRLGSR